MLCCHLCSNIEVTDFLFFIFQGHEMTSVGLLLGIAAAK